MAENNGQLKLIAGVATMVAALLLAVAFFLPYAAGVDEYRETLGATSANPYSETLGMSNEDLADISLFEYARIYSASGELGMPEEFALVYVPLTVAPAVLGALTLLLPCCASRFLIVFSVLTVALTFLLTGTSRIAASFPVIRTTGYRALGVSGCRRGRDCVCLWQIVLRRQAK